GLILTDDLEMGAVEQEQGAAFQALAALAAGNDGLMFCGSREKILEAYEGGLAALRAGKVDERRIRQSLRRILALKKRFLKRRRVRFSEQTLERARRALAPLATGGASGFDPTARVSLPAGETLSERPPRQSLEDVDIAPAGPLDDLFRQRRGRGILVPTDRLEIVAHILLVQRRLGAPRLIALLRPEARRIGGEDLVREDQPFA